MTYFLKNYRSRIGKSDQLNSRTKLENCNIADIAKNASFYLQQFLHIPLPGYQTITLPVARAEIFHGNPTTIINKSKTPTNTQHIHIALQTTTQTAANFLRTAKKNTHV